MAKQSDLNGKGKRQTEPRLAKKITVAKGAISSSKKAFPLAKAALAIIGLLIIAGLAFIGLNYVGSKGLQQLPVFQNLNSAPKSNLAVLPSLQSFTATQQLANLTSSHLSNISEFTVDYAGKIYAHGTGAASLLAFNSPLNVSLSRYGDISRFDINATSASVFGDVNIIYLGLSNGTFTCENFNLTAASSGNENGVLFGSRNVQCNAGSELLGIKMNDISNFDFYQLSQFGITPSYTDVYQSEYHGQNCTYISGTLAQASSNGTNTGSGIFGMCLSDTYYVPLSLSAIFSGPDGSFSFYMNETSISNSSSQSGIDTLPGHVV